MTATNHDQPAPGQAGQQQEEQAETAGEVQAKNLIPAGTEAMPVVALARADASAARVLALLEAVVEKDPSSRQGIQAARAILDHSAQLARAITAPVRITPRPEHPKKPARESGPPALPGRM